MDDEKSDDTMLGSVWAHPNHAAKAADKLSILMEIDIILPDMGNRFPEAIREAALDALCPIPSMLSAKPILFRAHCEELVGRMEGGKRLPPLTRAEVLVLAMEKMQQDPNVPSVVQIGMMALIEELGDTGWDHQEELVQALSTLDPMVKKSVADGLVRTVQTLFGEDTEYRPAYFETDTKQAWES